MITGKTEFDIVFAGILDFEPRILKLRQIWNLANANRPFEFQFLDDDVQKQYESYQRWTNIVTFATCFAAIIAGIGLYGLAGINTLNRYKEIGIRKICGADFSDILVMLNWKYVLLVFVATIFAVPISYYGISKWLQNFKYSLPLQIESMVGIAAGLGLTVVIIAVSYHAIRASLLNPAEIIKHE
jgi:putative ABC transport system permease protein